jgi:hypothetical protein
MHTIYFAEVEPQYLEHANANGLFYSNDKYYWFKVEIEEDFIRIYDTCNRMIPVDMENISTFVEAINAADFILQKQQLLLKALEDFNTSASYIP